MTFYFDSTKLISSLSTLIVEKNFWMGVVNGLQEVSSTDSDCYSYTQNMLDFIWSSQYAFVYDQFMTTVAEKGIQGTDGGFQSQVFESLIDFGLLFFNVYNSCYVDNLLQIIGKMTSGQAMAGDYMLNLGTEFYAYYQKSSESKILALETALADTSNTSYEPIGYAIGAILTEAFDYSIPVYVFDEYGKADTNSG